MEEFDRLYGHQNGWEFWFGEARRKSVPTHLHGILALLLGDLLQMAGYISSVETDLKVVPDWQPRPDVSGVLEEIESRYPNKPVDVVFEVLSKDDDIVTKCIEYTRIGVPQIFAFDPEARTVQQWIGGVLLATEDVKLANGVTITGKTLWTMFEARQHLRPPASRVI